jgi:hypothetical protein
MKQMMNFTKSLSLEMKNLTVMATLVTKLSFVTRVAISGVWLTSH